MEDIKTKEEEIITDPTPDPVEEPEDPIAPDPVEEEKEDPKEEDVDHAKELERLETLTPPKSEREKAEKALHFNAERVKELGGDPATVLNFKPETPENANDPTAIIQREFKVRDARMKASSDEEFKHIMWYVDNRGLEVDEAHILANKGKIQRSVIEAKRGAVNFGRPEGGGRKVVSNEVPDRSEEEKRVLQDRGLRFNPKTKTYQGKIYEEYFDAESKSWQSRRIRR